MKETILIIDDEPEILENLETILSDEGHEVVKASSGNEAVENFKAGSFGLVITDMKMPGISGLEVLQRVKQIDKDVEVIILTGYGTMGNAIQALRNEGAYDYLGKPLEYIEKLLVTVENALERRRTYLVNDRLLGELRESEEKYRLIFVNSPIPIWEENFSLVKTILDDLKKQKISDIEMYLDQHPHTLQHCVESIKVVDVNRAVLSLFKAASKDELLANLFNLFTLETLDTFRRVLICVWNGGTEAMENSVVKTLSGDLRDVTIYFSVCPGYEETFSKVFVSFIDITERKKLEASLLQAQKMESIGNLAGGIAHDFNNILSAIIGFNELALEAAPKGSVQREDLEEVSIAGNRAKELVQQILAFARQSEEETKPVRLSDIVTEALKLLRPSTPTTIDIKPNINSTAKVMGNPSQLHQIVMNLCTNAIHSLQKSGEVLEISLRDTFFTNDSEPNISELPSGEYLELTVTDNGSGIDPAIIDNIFEPYFTTKGVGEGSGMGLAMVKGIVDSYGGDIHVKSEQGKKTSFVIRLPRVTGRTPNVVGQVDPFASGTERILFVDDEPPIARMGSRILESLGYTVTVRTSSFEALELFKEKPDAFDLIITDMTMPSMTGDVLSMEIRKLRHNIPIILCTGYSNKINEDGAKQIGVDAFTYKPLTKIDLARTIREVLDTNRSSAV